MQLFKRVLLPFLWGKGTFSVPSQKEGMLTAPPRRSFIKVDATIRGRVWSFFDGWRMRGSGFVFVVWEINNSAKGIVECNKYNVTDYE